MEIQYKRKNPFEVLGLQDGEISLNKIEEAYRIKRQQLSDLENTNSQNSQILFDEIEKAFQELVNYLDDDSLQDQEEVVISAAFLPKSNTNPVKKLEFPKPIPIADEDEYKPVYKPIISNKAKQNIRPIITRPVENIMNAKVGPRRMKAEATNNLELLNNIDKMLQDTEKINGAILKKIREKMSVSIDEMSLKIKVSKSYLDAIESDHFEDLPAEVYTKGFFNSYLNYLGIDKKHLVEALMEIYRDRKRLIKKK